MTDKELSEQKHVSWAERIPPAPPSKGETTLPPKVEKQFKVWLRFELSEKGQNLAQQLLTTLGTLVVAIASFYFGSSSVSSAVTAMRGGGGTGSTNGTNTASKTNETKVTTKTSGTQPTISNADPGGAITSSQTPPVSP